jgi:hypothetical protein
MPIQLPNLDDRTYDDLVQEALSLIPTYAPEWTNHNPSDPGITLIELFAYLTEMLNYRLNRVTNANKQAFLNLISESKYPLDEKILDEKTLNEKIQEAVLTLRSPNRAIGCEDFETLALAANPQVARARCLPRRNLKYENSQNSQERPGHVSVVIVPKLADLFLYNNPTFTDYTDKASPVTTVALPLYSGRNQFLYVGLRVPFKGLQFQLQVEGQNYNLKFEYFDGSNWNQVTITDHQLVDETANWTASGWIKFEPPKNWKQTTLNGVTDYWLRIYTTTDPSATAEAFQIIPKLDVIESVEDYLKDRRLLTTKLHIVEPRYVHIGVHLTLYLKSDALKQDVEARVVDALKKFLHPNKGGMEGKGWQFGRNVYVSEIYQLLDQLPGIDYVQQIGDRPELTVRNSQNPDNEDSDATGRLLKNENSKLIAVKVKAEELVSFTKIELEFEPKES